MEPMPKRKTRRVSCAPHEPSRTTKQDTGEFYFDHAEADFVCEFFRECLHHTKGEWAGQPLVLEEWQERDIVRPLFGWKRRNGLRRYRTAYVEVPKKNGKSTLGAGIGLYLLFADGEQGAEIYSVAADRDQAAIIFDTASTMRDTDDLLRQSSLAFKRQITVHDTRSFYKVLSADVKTKHGLNANGVIFDELHAQPNRDLFDVMKGAGAARRQPLHFYITTAGFDRMSICWEMHDYADKILRGVLKDDSFLAVMYAADEKDDWTDPKTWKKANPNLGRSVKLEFLKNECKEAQEKPAYQNTFKRLHLNIWTTQESKWLPYGAWDGCAFEVDEAALDGRECLGGLDLATTTDLAAFVRVFPPAHEGEPIKILPSFWIPKDNIEARVKRDRVPYDAWVRDGWVEATEGNVIDYKVIRKRILEMHAQTPLREIAFDRWGSVAISTDLQEEGITMAQFGQGFASMSAPTKELLRLLLEKQIAHGGHPVLRWMADNVMVVSDAAMNIKPDRAKSREKIDGIVALIMALDRHLRETGSVYAGGDYQMPII
jgi:phage terminase large subunit-like protein